jgi:hypothetical protein
LVATEGYAIISSEKWRELFERAGVPTRLEEGIINHWVGIEGPAEAPFLWRAGDDPAHAYRLASRYEADHQLISRSGMRENRGRVVQRMSLKAKL